MGAAGLRRARVLNLEAFMVAAKTFMTSRRKTQCCSAAGRLDHVEPQARPQILL